jgi:hypothetical protein
MRNPDRRLDLANGLIHVAFNYVVKGGRKVRKDTKTHQDRHLAIDSVTCALVQESIDELAAALAAVGVTLKPSAYLFSNEPAHARPWNPDWVTHRVMGLARAAAVKLDIKGIRHYTASQLLAWVTPPRGSATPAGERPRSGTMRTRSLRSTVAQRPTSPSSLRGLHLPRRQSSDFKLMVPGDSGPFVSQTRMIGCTNKG